MSDYLEVEMQMVLWLLGIEAGPSPRADHALMLSLLLSSHFHSFNLSLPETENIKVTLGLLSEFVKRVFSSGKRVTSVLVRVYIAIFRLKVSVGSL